LLLREQELQLSLFLVLLLLAEQLLLSQLVTTARKHNVLAGNDELVLVLEDKMTGGLVGEFGEGLVNATGRQGLTVCGRRRCGEGADERCEAG
jgi:hypothetical protein